MKLFFATGSREYLYLLLMMKVQNILCSFAYPEPYLSKKLLQRHGIKMMVDSGAFTSWSKGKEVNIDDYVEFIKKNIDIIDTEKIVNLDVIMGGRKEATQLDFDEACKKGFENYYYIKEKTGFDPIHVFHQGENFVWLEKMLKECTYIGISPNKDESMLSVDKWLYECFYHIAKSGNSNIKTHAFGLTSESLLQKYPYYSADSSAWALTSAFGTVITPYGRVLISETGKDDPDYIEYKLFHERNKIIEYVESFGFSYNLAKDFKKGYKYRNIINIWNFLEIERKLNENPVKFDNRQKPLFDYYEMDKKRHELMMKKQEEKISIIEDEELTKLNF